MYMTERLFCVYESIFLEQDIALGHIFGPGYLLYSDILVIAVVCISISKSQEIV